ncbi:MAG: hypothetical protein F6K62_17030 [Sphaerospermopsis sp. SIO1G2]|nr:hypothetical protein [Sphaerospermopsis sp. SIO1G2]
MWGRHLAISVNLALSRFPTAILPLPVDGEGRQSAALAGWGYSGLMGN